VSVKTLLPGATTQKEDVTTLSDSQRVYADPPLKDVEAGGATASCTASGFLEGAPPQITPANVTEGWICEESEVTYEVGKYATWSGSWSYYEPQST
jgi:hypothetical protein